MITSSDREHIKAIIYLYHINDLCFESDRYVNLMQFCYLSEIKQSTIDELLYKEGLSFDFSRFVVKEKDSYKKVLDLALEHRVVEILDAAIQGKSYDEKITVPAKKVLAGREIFDFLNSYKCFLELRYTVCQDKQMDGEQVLAFKVYGEDERPFCQGEVFKISLEGRGEKQAKLLRKTIESNGGYSLKEDEDPKRISSQVSDLNRKLSKFRSLRAVSDFHILRSQMDNKEIMNNILDNYGINHNQSLGGKKSPFFLISLKGNEVQFNIPFQKYTKVASLSKL